jgi:hypothetical protein
LIPECGKTLLAPPAYPDTLVMVDVADASSK